MKDYLEKHNLNIADIIKMSQEERQNHIKELEQKADNIFNSMSSVVNMYLDSMVEGISYKYTLNIWKGQNGFDIMVKGGIRVRYHGDIDNFVVDIRDMAVVKMNYSSNAKDAVANRELVRFYSELVNNLDMKNRMKEWNEMFCNDYRCIYDLIKYYRVLV